MELGQNVSLDEISDEFENGCGSVLWQGTSEPSLVLVKPGKDMNNVSCHRDMTEILLKA